MLGEAIRKFWPSVRGSFAHRFLISLGLQHRAKRFYHRLLIRKGYIDTHFGGINAQFRITSPAELNRLEGLNHEEQFLKSVVSHLKPQDIFFDIGANIGMISIPVAIHGQKSGVIVYSFEPEPRNFARLSENAELNRLTNLKANQLALGEARGTIQMQTSGDVGTGTHSIITKSKGPTIDVPMLTADEFCKERSISPDVAKIDVEGAEVLVIRGMQRLLAERAIRHVFIEVHHDLLAEQGLNKESLDQLILTHGYHIAAESKRDAETHIHYARN